MSELYVPIIMPMEYKVITLGDHSLLHTDLPDNASAERTARQFAANTLGLTAIKAIGGLRHEDAIGYGVHTSHDQPYLLRPEHRFVLTISELDQYLNDDQTDETSKLLVDQAVSRLPYRRRAL